jgi:DNA replication and repair protein RecF
LVRRNAALRAYAGRSASVAADAALGAWEPALASSGATLWAERSRWTARWAPEFARVSAAIGERGLVEIRYVPRLPDERDDVAEDAPEAALAVALEAALEADRGRDIRRGATRTGPHRDDLVLTLDGRALRAYGSAGQQRSAAIGLRILESYALRDRGGASPVLLFDDPFAELDERRARAILEVLGGPAPGPAALGQVVLAVPRAADIPVGLTRLARYGIADGMLSRDAA